MNGIFQLCIQNLGPYKGNEARGREMYILSTLARVMTIPITLWSIKSQIKSLILLDLQKIAYSIQYDY